jgi:hypothetical protein
MISDVKERPAQMAGLRTGLLVTALLGLTGPTSAQGLDTMLGTLHATAQPIFRDGRLTGCTVVYGALARDFTHKQGGYIAVNGNFGLMSGKGQVAVNLKVVMNDTDPRTNSFTPSPPASAYFVSGSKTTKSAVVSHIPSDTPGAIFVVLKPEEVQMEGLQRSKVTIAFARQRGGMDILLPIDTSVVETKPSGQRIHSPQAATDFLQCGKELLDSMDEKPSADDWATPDPRGPGSAKRR